MSRGGPCTMTCTVVVVSVLPTIMTDRDFVVSRESSTQSGGFRVNTAFGKVISLLVPATESPSVVRVVVIATIPPAGPVPVPTSICTVAGVGVVVGVAVGVADGVSVGVTVAVSNAVGVGVSVGVAVGVSLGTAVGVSVGVGV